MRRRRVFHRVRQAEARAPARPSSNQHKPLDRLITFADRVRRARTRKLNIKYVSTLDRIILKTRGRERQHLQTTPQAPAGAAGRDCVLFTPHRRARRSRCKTFSMQVRVYSLRSRAVKHSPHHSHPMPRLCHAPTSPRRRSLAADASRRPSRELPLTSTLTQVTTPLSTNWSLPAPHCGHVKESPKNLCSRPAAGKST